MEFSKISKGSQTIDRNQADTYSCNHNTRKIIFLLTLVLEKLEFNSNDTQGSDLPDNANMISDGFINLDDMLSIIDKLLIKRIEPIEVVDDEPNLKKFVKRVKELTAENVVVTKDMVKQLQQNFNIPDHLLE
ncbi:unnamed protein product [Rotaria sp. Silwood1]|nr:unnamed protein product [Rotaria sp. Silwood1]